MNSGGIRVKTKDDSDIKITRLQRGKHVPIENNEHGILKGILKQNRSRSYKSRGLRWDPEGAKSPTGRGRDIEPLSAEEKVETSEEKEDETRAEKTDEEKKTNEEEEAASE